MKILFPHNPQKKGGPSSFQKRFMSFLESNGHSLDVLKMTADCDYIFVMSGTRKLLTLIYFKFIGTQIIQRLDGIDVSYRNENRSFLTLLKAEIQHVIVVFIYFFIANKVVFQSQFVKEVWFKAFSHRPKYYEVIYNGFSLSKSDKLKLLSKLKDFSAVRIVCVEGMVKGQLAQMLLSNLPDIEVCVYGDVHDQVRLNVKHENLRFMGYLFDLDYADLYTGKSIYCVLEENPPCPNSVIEALACGVPVIAVRGGSISELVDHTCGIILDVDYEVMTSSEMKTLLKMAVDDIILNYNYFSRGALIRANTKFDSHRIFLNYLNFIES